MLKLKITGFIVFIQLLAILVINFANINHLHNINQKFFNDRVSLFADFIFFTHLDHLSRGDTTDIMNMAKSIREILYLKIQNAEDDILFQYSADFEAVDLNYMISLSKSIVTDNDEFLGTVTVQVCSAALKKIFTEFTSKLLFISLIGVFISGIVVWAALSLIFAPLKLIELNLGKVLSNPQEIPEGQSGEIGLVVHSFNKLAMEVRKTYMGKGNEPKDP